MDWKIDIDHDAAMATTDFVVRALAVQGSVLLDPQSVVTLALAYRHARFPHEYVERPRGDAECTCGAWFYHAGVGSPYHDERQRYSWEEHVKTGRHMDASEIYAEIEAKKAAR